MSTTFTPVYTRNTAGNADASASLAAGANRSFNLDISGKWMGILHVKNTPGGTVAATRGLKIEVYRQYSSSDTQAQSPLFTVILPSATASTAESTEIELRTGKYTIKITNLDASNAITVEATLDTVDSVLGA